MTGTQDTVAAVLALGFGFMLQRGGLCTVAAVNQVVRDGRWTRFAGIGSTVAWAGVLLLAAALVWPDRVQLAGTVPVGATLIGGAVLLGVGSAVNGGCFVGSVLRVSSGDSNFLATFVGMAIGIALFDAMFRYGTVVAPNTRSISTNETMGIWAALLALAGAGGAAMRYGFRWHRLSGASRVIPRVVVHAGVGIAGALLLLRVPAWSYSSAFDDVARLGHHGAPWARDAISVAMFVGAVVSAWLGSSFRWVTPRPGRLARHVLGGTLMGLGAHAVPGGNDLLLLWVIPSLAAYGLVACILMTTTIASVQVTAATLRSSTTR